jgi:peroxiredoxin
MLRGTRTARRPGIGLVLASLALATVAGWAQTAKPARTAARLDFLLKDASGKSVRLADFKGRPLIINFWATYCTPCKAEMPALIALIEEFKAKQLTVLGISVDDSADEIRAFQKEFPHPFPANYPLLVGSGHDDLLEAYQADIAVPVTWLIRPDGSIATKAEGPQSKEWFQAQIKAMF